jgi:phosphoribosylaminoimidazole-succinocarboxamide synthase
MIKKYTKNLSFFKKGLELLRVFEKMTPLIHRKILEQMPGQTVYASPFHGQVYHALTDVHSCPRNNQVVPVPGRGALTHRLSCFLFEKLIHGGVPCHFLRSCNMQEALMQETVSLPFQIKMHFHSGPNISQDWAVSPLHVFDPAVVEYVALTPGYHLNEDFMMALGWMDQEEIEDFHALVIRIGHVLQGVLAAFNLVLVNVRLTLATNESHDFVLAGHLGADTMTVYDPVGKKYWGAEAMEHYVSGHTVPATSASHGPCHDDSLSDLAGLRPSPQLFGDSCASIVDPDMDWSDFERPHPVVAKNGPSPSSMGCSSPDLLDPALGSSTPRSLSSITTSRAMSLAPWFRSSFTSPGGWSFLYPANQGPLAQPCDDTQSETSAPSLDSTAHSPSDQSRDPTCDVGLWDPAFDTRSKPPRKSDQPDQPLEQTRDHAPTSLEQQTKDLQKFYYQHYYFLAQALNLPGLR